MIEVKEILRLWLDGRSQRDMSKLSGPDRETVRRYVETSRACGVDRDGEATQLTDELLGAMVSEARSQRPHGHGASWEALAGQHEQLKEWVDTGSTPASIHMLLGRRGVVVSYRRCSVMPPAELGFGRKRSTVPIVDGEPGSEIQIDFGRLGLIPDPVTGTRRVVNGLIFTAVYSRIHMLVYPTHRQTLDEVIAGFEAAWAFFDGVFAVVIPDNMKAIVEQAHATDPRINDTFREYAQFRGLVVDPTQVRKPCDKPRVERCVSYVRSNLLAGEDFRDLADCRARAERACHSICVGPGWFIIGPPLGRIEGVFCDEDHAVGCWGEVGRASGWRRHSLPRRWIR